MGNCPIGSQNFTEDGLNHLKRIYSTSSGAGLLDTVLTDVNVNVQVTITEPRDYTEERQNNLRRIHDSAQHINTTYHSSTIKASLLAISLTETNVNGQVPMTEPHDYTEGRQNNFRCVHDSVQHVDTTYHSSSIKTSSLAIALTDTNVN